jgi:ArsR family transcriptional regulator
MHLFSPKRSQLQVQMLRELREYYVALSDATRLRILQQLAHHESTVTEIARSLRMSQPLVSWHLRRLVRTGLIRMQRDGREVRCSLDRARMHEYERNFDSLIASQ